MSGMSGMTGMILYYLMGDFLCFSSGEVVENHATHASHATKW
jgi:hypothetical protein